MRSGTSASTWLLALASAACTGGGSDTSATSVADTSTGEAVSESTGSLSSGDTTGGATLDGTDAATDDSTGQVPLAPADILLMESVVFYDGYAALVDEPVPDGIVRLSNSLHAVRLTAEQLAVIQPHLQLQVVIGALCDNYDRIGSVQLALVPKGARTYDPAEVPRIELARFITPFMDFNDAPDTVPYEWDIDNVAEILTDPQLQAEYDMWMELDVFGVPYAANTEIAGCKGRNDVFRGWLGLRTDSTVDAAGSDTLIPLAVKEAFNNYQDGASDVLGTTRKTVEITLARDAEDARLVLITSNHGANAGGEEYNRREHLVYVDGQLALQYTPGRDSCEPFRMYNTQGNGIYGPAPKTDDEWQSFSNWCPGDVIDTRIIEWGAVSAGVHEFVIDVPDATFVGGEGNIPLSLYLQAR
jgi:hypothetical protein